MPHCICLLKEAATDAPQAIAFKSNGCALSFSSLDAAVEQTVSELESLGLTAGERLAVSLDSGLRFYTLLFASLRLGATFCPLNLRLPPLAQTAHLARLAPKLFISSTVCQMYDTSLQRNALAASLLLFTSGSTGSAKLVLLSLANMIANAASAIAFARLLPGDTWLLSLPLHHVGGLSILFRCLLARACVTTDSADGAITHLSYVPAQLYQSWPIYPKLRCLLLGGGPIKDLPAKLPISISYGMTETASLILGCRHLESFPYLGFPLPGKEIKLAEDGEIWVKGDSLFQGYWNSDGLDTPFDREGWFATNDLGRFDASQGFAITGRKDNQFISGGENIQPEEIEQQLIGHPEILDAIVVPIEDPRFGSRPVACLRTINPSIDLQAIERNLAMHLPKYKLPIAFFLLDECAEIGLKLPRKKILEFVQKKFRKER